VDRVGALYPQRAGLVPSWRAGTDLIMRLGRSRDDGFEQFFLAHFEHVAASVRYVCGDAERANDATQEAFIRAYARWGRVRHYDNPAGWVRRIAINATRDAFRSDTRRARREQSTASKGEQLVEHELPGSSLGLLDSLPDRQRAIAALYYLDDLTVAEISDLLGIAEGTVRFHLSQARASLRTLLRPTPESDHAR
jgi:RNA polymerase sigma-70 factor (ECF subfamily)